MISPILKHMSQKAPTGEVSLWAVQLAGHALPWVCVKSGRPAAGTIRVQYQNNPNAAWAGLLPGSISRRYVVKGQLPMSLRWIAVLTTARCLVIAAMVAFGYGFWAVTFGREPNPVQWVLLFAGTLTLVLWSILRGQLEPTGEVHRDAAGNAWVVIRGVHPNFVAAVEALRAGGAAANPQST